MADQVYDGFISYSHAADGLLAPRLQAGLQRFAKPWWKRRAVRIFRDESSLSANPHLWSSITDALDRSGWFVLLLSPDAARSEWVNQEIAYWKTHRDPSRILPVVTDGGFGWTNGDVSGDGVPEELRGVFVAEPRWVDLRFARDEEHLDLKNPRFSAAVADIASALRGVPKDELESEEVNQHRRTIRTAWTGVAAIGVLAIAAAAFGIQSASNAAEAERQAEIASQNEAEAERLARSEAEARVEAEANALAAARNADLAVARELAASAIGVIDSDPELATLLAIEAIDSAPSDASLPAVLTNALWRAGQENRLVNVYEHGHGGTTHLALSRDGEHLAVSAEEGASVSMYDESGSLRWEYSEDTTDSFAFISMVPDGSRVSVAVIDSNAPAATRNRLGGSADNLPNRILVLDGTTGSLVTSLEFPDCVGVEPNAWSHDGRFLAIGSGLGPCVRDGVPGWVEVYETTDWTPVAFLPVEESKFLGSSAIPKWDSTGRLFLFDSPDTSGLTAIHEADTFELERSIGSAGLGDVTADGTQVVTGATFFVALYDTETGAQTDVFTPIDAPFSVPLGIEVSDDGSLVAVSTIGRYTAVFDMVRGTRLFGLPGGSSTQSQFDLSRQRLYTGHKDGTVKVWDLSSEAVGVEPLGDLGSAQWVNGNNFSIGPVHGAFLPIDLDTNTWYVRFFDVANGRLTPDPDLNGYQALALPDGRFIVETVEGQIGFYDVEEDTFEAFLGCTIDLAGNCEETGEPGRRFRLRRTIAGDVLIAAGLNTEYVNDGTAFEVDPATGAMIRDISDEPWTDLPLVRAIHAASDDWVLVEIAEQLLAIERRTGDVLWQSSLTNFQLSPSGRYGALMTTDSVLVVVDLDTWEESRIKHDFGNVRGMSFDAEERRIALGGSGLTIVDLEAGALAQTLRIPGVSDAHWLGKDRLVIGTNQGVWGSVSLDTAEFLSDTRSSLRRSFTDTECLTYRIDPCPTLEEIRGR